MRIVKTQKKITIWPKTAVKTKNLWTQILQVKLYQYRKMKELIIQKTSEFLFSTVTTVFSKSTLLHGVNYLRRLIFSLQS
jgi:hypothetical protein